MKRTCTEKAWESAEQTHQPRPLGKGGDSFSVSAVNDATRVNSPVNDATRVNVPAHRAAKVGAFGNRGRTLGLRSQRGK